MAGESVKWSIVILETSLAVSYKVKQTPDDPGIPLLSTYTHEKGRHAPTHKKTPTQIYRAASFIIAQSQKQPKYLSTSE